MSNLLKMLLVTALAIIAAGLLADGAPSGKVPTESDASVEQPVVRRIPIDVVVDVPVQGGVTLHGMVRARERLQLSLGVSGTLVQRSVNVGDSVEPGQLLVRVHDPHLDPARHARRAEIDALVIRTAQLRRDLARFERLADDVMISEGRVETVRTELEETRARVRLARANLKATEQALEESRRRAPFAAIVTETHYEQGEFVHAGSPVLTLSGLDGFEVEVRAPESLVNHLSHGQIARVVLPFQPGPALEGRIRHLAKAATSSGLYPVVIELPETPRVRAGFSAHVEFQPSTRSHLAVPLSALDGMTGSQGWVFAIEDGVARSVDVSVVGIRGRLALVKGAIQPGQAIAAAGASLLRDGERVEAF